MASARTCYPPARTMEGPRRKNGGEGGWQLRPMRKVRRIHCWPWPERLLSKRSVLWFLGIDSCSHCLCHCISRHLYVCLDNCCSSCWNLECPCMKHSYFDNLLWVSSGRGCWVVSGREVYWSRLSMPDLVMVSLELAVQIRISGRWPIAPSFTYSVAWLVYGSHMWLKNLLFSWYTR